MWLGRAKHARRESLERSGSDGRRKLFRMRSVCTLSRKGPWDGSGRNSEGFLRLTIGYAGASHTSLGEAFPGEVLPARTGAFRCLPGFAALTLQRLIGNFWPTSRRMGTHAEVCVRH